MALPPCSGYEASDADLDEPVAYDGFGAPLYAHQVSVRRLPEYDDSWLARATPRSFVDSFPLHVVLPMADPDPFRKILESDGLSLSRRIVQIHDECLIRRVDQELAEEIYGHPMFRLCEREIPARGQE